MMTLGVCVYILVFWQHYFVNSLNLFMCREIGCAYGMLKEWLEIYKFGAFNSENATLDLHF